MSRCYTLPLMASFHFAYICISVQMCTCLLFSIFVTYSFAFYVRWQGWYGTLYSQWYRSLKLSMNLQISSHRERLLVCFESNTTYFKYTQQGTQDYHLTLCSFSCNWKYNDAFSMDDLPIFFALLLSRSKASFTIFSINAFASCKNITSCQSTDARTKFHNVYFTLLSFLKQNAFLTSNSVSKWLIPSVAALSFSNSH